MSNGKHVAGTGDSKPTCRLVSLTAESREGSAQANDKQLELRMAALGVVMVTLLGFACMGVVFTLKHRQLRSENQTNTELVQSDVRPSPISPSPAPSPKPKVVIASQQTAIVPDPSVAPVSNSPVQPSSNPTPPVEPEMLATHPREASTEITPPVVVEHKQRPAAMGETTREPETPVTSVSEMPKDKPVVQPSKMLPDTEPAIGPRLTTFGTKIGFYGSAAEANESARKDNEKLVMVVHYSGTFENGTFKADAVEEFRQNCLLHPDVVGAIREHFICSATKLGPSRIVDGRHTGNVVTYFCRWNGTVLHAVPGAVSTEEFLRELDWLQETRKNAIAEYQKDKTRYNTVFKKAHTDRYFAMAGNNPQFPMQPRVVGPLGGFPPFGINQGNPFIDPFAPLPFAVQPVPAQPAQKLPTKCPPDLNAQAKVHWLLGYQPVPELKDISRRVFTEFLKENPNP